MLTIGRVTFAPRTREISIKNQRPTSNGPAEIGVAQLLRAIGVEIGKRSWPLPCTDLNALHKLNAERLRARTKRKD